jgi:flavin reductase (DIM6/NTAB) family NADH-FMN oxidoreductase RutF
MSVPAPVAVDPIDLRRAAARFPSGVALVTAPGGVALVVDSFISVSLEPPLIAFTPSRSSFTWRRMRDTGRFAVNILGEQHADGIRDRARAGANRLDGLEVEVLGDGLPIVTDALASLRCLLVSEHIAGDHTIAVGRVEGINWARGSSAPLVFFEGRFGTVRMREP